MSYLETKRYPLNLPTELYERFDRACLRSYKKKSEVMRDLISKFTLIVEQVDIFPQIQVSNKVEDSAGLVAKSYHRVKEWWSNGQNHNGS